jgi:transposase
MSQLQLPIFPAGVTPINSQIAIACESGKVAYVHGHLPVFQHGSEDLASFRLITSQMIASGTVRQGEIVRTFGVPLGTVKRYVKLYREQGAKGFFAPRRHRSASVLKGETKAQAQALLDAGKSVPEVAEELKLLPNTLHKAIRAGRLHQPLKNVKKNTRR